MTALGYAAEARHDEVGTMSMQGSITKTWDRGSFASKDYVPELICYAPENAWWDAACHPA